MNRSLVLRNRQHTRKVDLRLLRQMARTLLDDLLAVEYYDLGICLVATPEITRLNEAFLHHAGPTDVITFDYHSGTNLGGQRFVAAQKFRALTKQCPPGIHGEIFVCVDEAVAQARRFRASWQSELARYVIHGVLHLRGLDDLHPATRRKMKRAEDRLLREVGLRFTLRNLGARLKLRA
jgi:probable rRNA maturation factor